MTRFKAKFLVIVLIIFVLVLTSCTQQSAVGDVKAPSENQTQTKPPEAEQGSKEPAEEQPPVSTIDYSKIKPNENGQIMLLMYHGIDKKETDWVRTPENFRKDLETLYEKGYRVINLKDYLENNIKVEAGYTPVVLTFDDGLKNQFNIIEENGEKKIDPDCAIGILEDFSKKHPDFGKGGSFYVYYPLPFRQKELIKEKFDFMVKNGYEIGNHTYTHEQLGKESAEGVQKALALNAKYTQEYLPGYDVFSLALPYGIAPKDEKFKYAISGEYEGVKYNNRAILKVGSNPAPAPNNVKYDITKLPRVRASEMNTAGLGMYDYLNYFEKNPGKRYISDGNPDTVVIPEGEEKDLNMDSVKDKQVITYKNN